MKIFRLSAAIFAISLFLTGCNSDQTQQAGIIESYPNDAPLTENEYWAKDNLDLQRVGDLLERSDDPGEFESYLNDDDGINNLDLNGDGYGDYISVQEYEDRDSNSRGLSLFSRFGPVIQEIATVLFYRDSPNYPGARILLNGNEQLYGDNNYYETNWQDRNNLGLVSYLYSDHEYYRSPYYYDNYPSGYQAYEIVDTPIYRTRIEQLYPQPVFVYTTAPTFVSKVKIKSPNNGKWMDKVHAKLAKPTKEQAEYIKSNPGRQKVAKTDTGAKRDDTYRTDKPGRADPPRSDRGDERGNPSKAERGAERGNPNQPHAPKAERPNGKPAKVDNPGKGQAPGKGQDQGKGQGQGKGGGQGKGKKP